MEIVETIGELGNLKGKVAYLGLEPSGQLHKGHLETEVSFKTPDWVDKKDIKKRIKVMKEHKASGTLAYKGWLSTNW